MIAGIGFDICEIQRVERAAAKAAFLTRVFSPCEQNIWRMRGENPAFLAGCFAGKEAVAKALGTGFVGFWPSDIEILRNKQGKPFVRLSGAALTLSRGLCISKWHISITNTADFAAAVVVATSIYLSARPISNVVTRHLQHLKSSRGG